MERDDARMANTRYTGNWGHDLPVVHRWAYDYSVPGYKDDFIPQNVSPADAPVGHDHKEAH